jgi:hypothetical protein
MSAFFLSQIAVVRPTGIIAQRIHLRTARPDEMQQIRQRDIAPVSLDQCSLAVLAGAPASARPRPPEPPKADAEEVDDDES